MKLSGLPLTLCPQVFEQADRAFPFRRIMDPRNKICQHVEVSHLTCTPSQFRDLLGYHEAVLRVVEGKGLEHGLKASGVGAKAVNILGSRRRRHPSKKFPQLSRGLLNPLSIECHTTF